MVQWDDQVLRTNYPGGAPSFAAGCLCGLKSESSAHWEYGSLIACLPSLKRKKKKESNSYSLYEESNTYFLRQKAYDWQHEHVNGTVRKMTLISSSSVPESKSFMIVNLNWRQVRCLRNQSPDLNPNTVNDGSLDSAWL